MCIPQATSDGIAVMYIPQATSDGIAVMCIPQATSDDVCTTGHMYTGHSEEETDGGVSMTKCGELHHLNTPRYLVRATHTCTL